SQLACGKLPHDAFLAHLHLEDGGLPPDEQLRFADQCVQWPLPSAHFHRGRALERLDRKDEAAGAYRRAIELAGDAPLPARASLALALLTQADAVFTAAQDPNGNPVAAAQARFLRK